MCTVAPVSFVHCLANGVEHQVVLCEQTVLRSRARALYFIVELFGSQDRSGHGLRAQYSSLAIFYGNP